MQQKQEDFLDKRNRLQGLEREHISVGRELAANHNDFKSQSFKHQNQLAQIDRTIASNSQELTASEAKRRLFITAPESGIATAVVAEVGQAVETCSKYCEAGLALRSKTSARNFPFTAQL